MKERKYKEDYRLVTQIDPKTGREKRVPVYKGKYYTLPVKNDEKKAFLRKCIACFALSLVSILLYLCLNSPSAFCIYVIPISGIGLFPMLYWGMGIFSLLRAPEKMTNVQKETGVGRVLRSALGVMVFQGLAVIGDIVFLFTGAAFAKEWPALVLLAACCFGGAACFFNTRRIYNAITTDCPG